jgi:hypothetical protein
MLQIKDYKNQIKNIRKDNIYNYEYEYWKGDKTHLEKDLKATKLFGVSRKGYEKYKECNPDSIIDYGGVVSLREVTDSVSGETIGYITERKLSDKPHIDEAKKIFASSVDYVKEFLKVEDTEAFMYYLAQEILIQDFNTTVDNILHQIDNLETLLEEYQEDEEFRKFFDKIIKL